MGITHLCFADDLFLFSYGDPWSVQILKDSLEEFGDATGLWPNKDKSSVFFCKVTNDNQKLIKDIMGFRSGTLPVKYLGVPLISTRLWHADCMPLIEKVKHKLLDWQNNWLSFAGRVQLALSVLSSMQVYWASVFILPVSVSKEIEKLIRNFIWSGADLAQGKAKVAWKDVCMTKEEGGLGIKPLFIWNKALMAFHLWSVVANRQSMWVKWIHTYRLKGRSFWEVSIPWDASWCWKKILGLRDEFRCFFKHKVGDGKEIFFWYDNWSRAGPLSQFFSPRDIASRGSTGSAKVADCIVNGRWKWPDGVRNIVQGLNVSEPCINTSIKDALVWQSRDGVQHEFNTRLVWKDFRVVRPRVSWCELVWFSNCIPKHAFILWLAIRKKLMTQDRMQVWQSTGDLSCVFCNLQQDSVNHLFFDCQFSQNIFQHFRLYEFCLFRFNSWDDFILKAAEKWKGKLLGSIINKLILGSLVYFLWQERNWRIFQNSRRTHVQIIGVIEESIRLKIMGMSLRDNRRVRDILCKWNISLSCLQSK